MAGYIGSKAVILSTTAAEVAGDITSTDASPEVILQNTTEEDTDGGRESKITFKGEQSGGEITTLAQIQASHDGTSDDEKGDLIFSTNDGADGNTPTERLRIKSDGHILPSVDNASDLGSTEKRFLDLHLSGGVSFDEDPSLVAGSVTAKTLDDYEEGTWTPTADQGITGFSQASTSYYVKVGSRVTVSMYLSAFTGKDANRVRIGGLPYTVKSGPYFTGVADMEAKIPAVARAQTNNTYIDFFKIDSSRSNFAGTDLGSHIIMSLTYQTT